MTEEKQLVMFFNLTNDWYQFLKDNSEWSCGTNIEIIQEIIIKDNKFSFKINKYSVWIQHVD